MIPGGRKDTWNGVPMYTDMITTSYAVDNFTVIKRWLSGGGANMAHFNIVAGDHIGWMTPGAVDRANTYWFTMGIHRLSTLSRCNSQD